MSVLPRDADFLAQSDFRILAENAPDIIACFDRSMHLLYINPAVEKLTGSSRDDLLGSAADELPFPPELTSIFIKRCLRVFQSGHVSDVDLILPAQTGARHFSTRIVPVKDEDGITVSVLTLSRDVTERVESEERQRFLAEFSARLVETPDYESTLIKLAQLMVEIMADGCAIDLHLGDGGMHRVTVAVKHNGIRVPDAAAASNSEACIVLPLKARGRRLGQLTLVNEQQRAGFDAYDLSFATELAARAALIVDNARLYQEARNASMAKSAFLASMSHELRTPLNAILGYTELLELGVAGPITEGQTQQLERIAASAWNLLTVIEEILTFSRVEAGREEMHAEPVTLSAILAEAAAMIRPIADRKALAFSAHTADGDVVLRTDRGKLRQILLNLLTNAIKFTESGAVRCEAKRHNGGVLFEVHDTGVGIPAEHFERIFEPFWQAAHGPVRRAGGTGLGLTVSRQLAQLLGGDIQVRSTVGQGSTFSAFIPSVPPTA